MSKNVNTKTETKIKKSFDPQEMRTNILPSFYSGFEPNKILERLNENLTESDIARGVVAQDEETRKLFTQAAMILGLDNHYPLVSTMKEDYIPLAIEFADKLNGEYACKTPSEKALSQVVVNAYIRLLDDTRRYNNCSEAGEYITDNRTKYLAMLSKQIDRANRQFLSALLALRQLKSPSIQISVKANTAFIAQNQQLNNNPNEINSP